MTSPEISSVIQNFQGHNLNDLQRAELMNRVDSKFLVPQQVLPEILQSLQEDFTALEIDNKRLFKYESIYFDTRDYLFYSLHHGGKLNRHKVRIRRYIDSGIQFLEVKFKNNKKRTIKDRIQIDFSETNSLAPYQSFLRDLDVPNPDLLQPVLKNQYQRMQLASEKRGERLTIDLNLSNQSIGEGNDQVKLNKLAIVELKQARVNRSSPFYRQARLHNIRPSSFSKYCMGMMFTQSGSELKYNRFKPILRRLDNITDMPLRELKIC